ncbi:endonuclease/exonuclease/phosphatase [Caballeronia turbans]|jgi:endonuclease/exonuclease/phosphatase family metal-dependent hydrolase|uniref:endonuclease/exonuclease/phosphatase family protein n=1 Tax=unclassified Caballeronia TaxID=2646786 RepID=UPI00074D110B|nr:MULTISPECIES: endonuclease/exonuclease/phosphatase family protein [unclassified Caballeronia]SAL29678.1 endonuclease/exonuclease/phosphatase [Caballeronia turbans]
MTLMHEAGIENEDLADTRARELRIATYNLHGAIGIDGKFAPERIGEVLAEIDADIFALQEVPLGGNGSPDVLDVLQRMTNLHAVAGPTLDTPERRYGNAVLTRYPVRAVRTLDLSFRSREPRGALDADIDCGGELWRVVATHLGLASSERRAQVELVLQNFDTPALPVILLGDLNEWFVYGRTLRRLVTHFHRASALRTFPTRYPLFALDRIWVHPGERLMRVDVHRTRLSRIASDHYPLIAHIAHRAFASSMQR